MDRADRIRLRREARTLWSRQDSWPFETLKHVFFAQAIHRLGAMQFADEWPDDISAICEDARFDTVASSLREHCAYGRLVGALQKSDGSIDDKLPAHVWNNPDYVEWFATGKAPLILCYDDWHPLARIPQCWLFIEKAGLAALALPEPKVSPEPTHIVQAAPQSPSPRQQTTEKKRIRTPQQQLIAKRYLGLRFPTGIPGVDEMTDTGLVNEVSKFMETAMSEGKMPKGTAPKRDSILRAAGRKPSGI